MKSFKLFWGISGPVSLCILAGLTSLWIAFLVTSGLKETCEHSNSIIRKGSGNIVRSVLSGNFPELRNTLNLLKIPAINALTFEGANSIDHDVFGRVVVGSPPGWFSYVCKTNIEQMGLNLGIVRSRVDILTFATARLRNEIASILFFWVLAVIVIVITNYRALRVLGSINESLESLAQQDSNANLRNILARAIEAVPKNPGTQVILDSLSAILNSLAEVADLKLRTSRAEDKIQLARQVGHDIRSPLSALRILMERSKNLSAGEQDLLRSSYKRVEEIASNLLASAQSASGQTETDLNLCVEEVIKEKQLQYSRVELCFKRGPEAPCAFTSKSDLQRIISNLLNNSVEAHASKIVVQVSKSADAVELSVADNGIGMSAEILSQIRCGLIATTKGADHGLGLSHAQRTIKKHGGEMEFNRSILNGIEVKIRLPITQDLQHAF